MHEERVGLFGGSFDPIHFGHLILAREARESLGLNRVIFLPARVSPHKLDRPPAPAEIRLEMVRLAVAGESGFSVDDREIRRVGVSYTIDTIRELAAEFPGVTEWVYFLGDDNLAKLDTWREIEALRSLVKFVVLAREDVTSHPDLPVIQRVVDISSTEVRKRVAQGRSIRYLLPEDVCALIARNGLYRDE